MQEKENTEHTIPNDKWRIRRTIVIMTLVFCATCICYITLFGEDTRVNETILIGCFTLAGATIGSYVFGAVWDDNNIIKNNNKRGR